MSGDPRSRSVRGSNILPPVSSGLNRFGTFGLAGGGDREPDISPMTTCSLSWTGTYQGVPAAPPTPAGWPQSPSVMEDYTPTTPLGMWCFAGRPVPRTPTGAAPSSGTGGSCDWCMPGPMTPPSVAGYTVPVPITPPGISNYHFIPGPRTPPSAPMPAAPSHTTRGSNDVQSPRTPQSTLEAVSAPNGSLPLRDETKPKPSVAPGLRLGLRAIQTPGTPPTPPGLAGVGKAPSPHTPAELLARAAPAPMPQKMVSQLDSRYVLMMQPETVGPYQQLMHPQLAASGYQLAQPNSAAVYRTVPMPDRFPFYGVPAQLQLAASCYQLPQPQPAAVGHTMMMMMQPQTVGLYQQPMHPQWVADGCLHPQPIMSYSAMQQTSSSSSALHDQPHHMRSSGEHQ
jgi:hypothetical protein